MTSCSGWMVATMSRIGPTRGRSISRLEDRRVVRSASPRSVQVLVLVGGQLAALEAEPPAQLDAHRLGRAGAVERADIRPASRRPSGRRPRRSRAGGRCRTAPLTAAACPHRRVRRRLTRPRHPGGRSGRRTASRWGLRGCRPRRWHRPVPRSAGTSADATWPTPPATRWSSTGGPAVSTAFYRASRAEPMGVGLRRRFGFDRGALTAYEDEHLPTPAEADRGTATILAGEIERPARRARCATSSRPSSPSRTRSSAPTSSTTHLRAGRARHRQDRGRAAPRGVAALRVPRAAGPRRRPGDRAEPRRSCDHIGAVLPALGEVEVEPRDHRGAARARCPVRGADSRAEIAAQGRRPAGRGAAPRRVVARPRRADRAARRCRAGRTSWRVPAYEVAGDRRRAARRAASATAPRAQMLPQRLAHAVLVRDGARRRLPRRPGAGRRGARRRGPAATPGRCGRRSTRPRGAVPAARRRRRPRRAPPTGCSTTTSSALLLWATPPEEPRRRPVVGGRRGAARRGPRPPASARPASGTWCSTRRRTSRRCSCGRSAGAAPPARRRCSATSPRARRRGRPTRGTTSLRHLGKADAHSRSLDRGFRVPATVIEYAARLLPAMAPGLGAPVVRAREPGAARHRARRVRRPARPAGVAPCTTAR